MTAVFWVVVLLGILWLAYNVTSDRRNPPMKQCPACGGSGLVLAAPNASPTGWLDCPVCDGDGWIER